MPARKNRPDKHGNPQSWQKISGLDQQLQKYHPLMTSEVRAERTKLIQELILLERENPRGLHYVLGQEDEVFRMVNDKRLRAEIVNGLPNYSYVYVTAWFRIDYMDLDPNTL